MERIQKILARAGLGSRRQAEAWIADGLVTVNGKVAKLGDQADASQDHIKLKGKLLKLAFEPVYAIFHKRRGTISMMVKDPEGRPSILDEVPPWARKLFPVGRLQFNEEGMVLLTNDGEFSQALLKNQKVVRTYEIKVSGTPERKKLEGLLKGTRMGRTRLAPHSIRILERFSKATRLELVFQGMGAVDLKTLCLRTGLALERVSLQSIGQLSLERVPPGKIHLLRPTQAKALIEQPELGLKGVKPGLAWREPERKHPVVPNAISAKIIIKTPKSAAMGVRPRVRSKARSQD